jgi:hypothetical protein
LVISWDIPEQRSTDVDDRVRDLVHHANQWIIRRLNLADRSRGRLRRIQQLGVGYGLDESERVVGVGIAAAHHLLAERSFG